MIKRFLKQLSHNFCLYVLVAMNILHAIKNSAFDWLLWVSVALCALSIVLCFISAEKDRK